MIPKLIYKLCCCLIPLATVFFSVHGQAPVITSFTPASGPVGTLVTINGTSLNNPTAFTIGGRTAIVVSNTGSILVGLVMPGAVTGAVSISTADGTVTGGSNFTVTPNLYPGLQQGSKLVGTGSAFQGWSVALSADGNTAIVGGGEGAVVYTRSGSTWSQQGSQLVGTGGVGATQQGWSVALSADGNTAIVGGNLDDNEQGAAWVYTRSGITWSQQGSKLVGTGVVGSRALQGQSVALSADGNTAIVGGWADYNLRGAAWVYSRSGITWSQQGSKLVGTGNSGAAGQGSSVALSADGNTAIVGGADDNSGRGAAWVFTRSDSIWSQQGNKLAGTGGVGDSWQGYSVALSASGNTAMLGGPYDNYDQGAAWVFTRSGSTWSQQGSKLVGTGSVGNAQQGWSVALSANGNTAIVGGNYDYYELGAAWVYTRSIGTWSQQGGKLVGTGYTGIAQQGNSVDLSADGNTAIVGGPYDNSLQGAAWVYTPAPAPVITSFTPASGPPGTTVTITGTNFTGATSVSFGGVAASSFTVLNDTTITAIVAGGASGSVSVTTAVGTATRTGFIFNQPCTNVGISSVSAGATLVCTGSTTTLTAVGVTGTNAVVNWYTAANGGGTLLGTGLTLSNRGAGTYFARVTGDCGIPAQASIVLVGDTVKPELTCPANVVDYNTGGCTKSLTIPNPMFSDNCGIRSLTWRMSGKSTSKSTNTGINTVGTRTFKRGATTITYTLTDSANNVSTCSFTVRLLDTIKPSFQQFVSIFRDTALAGCSKMVKFPLLRFKDNCGTPTLTWTMSGSNAGTGTGVIDSMLLNVGVTTVRYTLRDSASNVATATHTITLVELKRPLITCPANITRSATTCSVSVSTPAPIYSDNCNVQSLVWTLAGATKLSSNTTGIRLVGTKVFNAGTTTVRYTVRDSSNNARFCTFNVVVNSSASCAAIAAKGINASETPGSNIELQVYPNPTSTSFGLLVKSASTEKATIVIYCGDGKRMEQMQVTPNRLITVGERYRTGTYLFEVLQGENRTTVKGIKR